MGVSCRKKRAKKGGGELLLCDAEEELVGIRDEVKRMSKEKKDNGKKGWEDRFCLSLFWNVEGYFWGETLGVIFLLSEK